MFKNLFGEKKLELDPTLGDRLAKSILGEARQGKVNTFFKEVEKLRFGEWDRREFYVDLVGENLTDLTTIQKLPDTPLGNLVQGCAALHFAWKARGSGRASTVTESGWKYFYQYLEVAQRCLLRAGEQDTEDPTPFALLQPVAMGRQLERAISDEWFYEAIRRDPTHQGANYRHLIVLCKKWGGSHEEMFDFARLTATNLPVGSILHFILYAAYQEYYLYLSAFDKDKAGAQAFLRDESIREESVRVYQKSLEQRHKIERVSDYWPHNVAAWWFLKLEMPDIVRRETKKIGRNFTEYPWAMFYKDAVTGYQKALDM
jgi:hypothetical protein